MQYRMEAVLRKYVSNEVTIINYAAYEVEVGYENSKHIYKNNICGMWDMNHYITLLIGEIPRLTDDENGYGPRGTSYIAHVDIPEEVKEAFLKIKKEFKNSVRKANPLYASKE